MDGVRVRMISREEVEPLLPALRADGLDVHPALGSWIGAERAGEIVGVVHLFSIDGVNVVDDVWVAPASRKQGIATAMLEAREGPAGSTAWLICDEPDIGFYAARGFRLVDADDLPAPLADHYAAKEEWPRSPDHEHFAMRSL